MVKSCKSFFYKFDLIGANPQLYIFNDERYKTKLSLFISIIILLFSIGFTTYSLVEYFKYDNPSVVYSKDNDENTERIIYIKDTLLMFQLVDTTSSLSINNSIAYYNADYFIIYDNGTAEKKGLTIEACEFGKNVDEKYREFIRDKSRFVKSIDEFYCFSFKDGNLSLFYRPNIGYSYIELYANITNNSYAPEKIQSMIVSESDTINHNNKKEPINKNYIYYLTTSYSSMEYTKVSYDFQFINYESDDGFFFKNSKYLTGISFSDMIFYKSIQDNYDLKYDLETLNSSRIGTITFGINKLYFDNYKRSYQKLQSLLAEVMSVISLLIEIGQILSSILCEKKMSTDIIDNLLNEEKPFETNNNNIKNIFEENKTNELFKEKKLFHESVVNINENNTDLKDNNIEENNSETKKDYNISKNNIEINRRNKILKKINYFHIIKSFFCFKDKRTKLIDLCHDIITEDMSVERILKRFYNLELLYQKFSNEESNQNDINKIKNFKEINDNIDKINNNLKKENYSNYQNNSEKENKLNKAP